MRNATDAGAENASTEDGHTAPQALVSLSNLCLRFGGVVALDDVSFDIPAGSISALIGPNGAGKTTLFNCLSRLCDCDSGRIVFDGQDITRLPPHRIAGLGIARTFQGLALFRSLSVLDNVRIGQHARSRGGFVQSALRLPAILRDERETLGRARELLHGLGLEAWASTCVSQLPFALQRRVEIARALAAQPSLLLLDEPASGLDHDEVAALARLIRELPAASGLTVMLVEHDMRLVMDLCDRVIVMNLGRKIAEGPPEVVQRHPAVLEAYLVPQP